MAIYKKLYYHTFNAITDVITLMEKEQPYEKETEKMLEKYIQKLKDIQTDAEEIYISSDDNE